MKRLIFFVSSFCFLLFMCLPVYASSPVSVQWYDKRVLSYQVGSSYNSYTEISGYGSTGLISVSSGDTVSLRFSVSTLPAYRVLFYDSGRTLTEVPYYGGAGDYTFVVPSGVSFFALRAYFPDSQVREQFYSLAVALTVPEPEPEPEPEPDPILLSISEVVLSAVHWIGLFCACIMDNFLLFLVVVLVIVGFGVGIIRRHVRL